jgi:hypothetical protein
MECDGLVGMVLGAGGIGGEMVSEVVVVWYERGLPWVTYVRIYT